jgi:hypothetical protein
VRNQMGKESARPQALLYVVPKLDASARWTYLLTFLANFGKHPTDEVRRIYLLRSRVNRPCYVMRGNLKGVSLFGPCAAWPRSR